MKTLFCLLIFVLCLLTCGCGTTGLAGVVKQLKDDHAVVDFKFNGWGSSVEFHRSNPTLLTNIVKVVSADVDGK